MATISTTYDGASFVRVEKKAQALRARITRKVGTSAKRLCPVDTGELLSKIDVQSAQGRVYSRAEHTLPVELGHQLKAWGRDTGRFVPPQPFLRPALYQAGLL